ncbi:MAG: NAD-dependent succinate-semialdehyde dehydrogenase [Bacteroidales bacterium]
MHFLKSVNPYDPSRIVNYPQLTDDELKSRLEKANKAFQDYRETEFGERSSHLMKVASQLKDRTRELAEIITREMGKPVGESEAEVKKCAWVCEYYAEHAAGFLSARRVETEARISEVRYRPLGPVLAVMPWNFPFWQVFRFAAPALMAGNTALLKHASNVQGSAQAIEGLFLEAGFGEGVFQNLAISADRVAGVIAHEAVRAVTLTGSEAAGGSVAAEAGRHLKKCVLELGGSNAFVVLDDADLDQALRFAMPARLQNGGQSCIAAKRFILEPGIAETFLSGLSTRVAELRSGDPMDKDTDLGPLSSEAQARAVEKQVARSVEMGAVLVTGGKRNGAFYAPTILTGVQPGMPVFDEEVFGPVYAILHAESPEHALELSNRSAFGLGMQVFTGSQESAARFADRAEEGAVFVNAMVKSDPRLPFGGIKRSGYGRELSVEGIREFVNIKTIWIES